MKYFNCQHTEVVFPFRDAGAAKNKLFFREPRFPIWCSWSEKVVFMEWFRVGHSPHELSCNCIYLTFYLFTLFLIQIE